MADGSSEDHIASKQMNNSTFLVSDPGLDDTKKCCEQSVDSEKVKLSFYTELKTSESCEGTDSVVDHQPASTCKEFQKPPDLDTEIVEDRKRRCFDRYDSSESSDSGVVLSPTESSGCSSSDITEPASPRSPESACSSSEESASARMPPWASDPAPPPAARRISAQPAPERRPNPPLHRRITEYFNHKMKPQNGIKRDCSSVANEDSKRKCLPRNNVTHDLEKYISYLSQTLNPKLLEIGNQPDQSVQSFNGVIESSKTVDLSKTLPNYNGLLENEKTKGAKGKNRGNERFINGLNGVVNGKKIDYFSQSDPNAKVNKHQDKVPIPVSSAKFNCRAASASSVQTQKNVTTIAKPDSTKMNGVVSSTTKLDCRMNAVTCGSNNINLNRISSKTLQVKKEPIKKTMQPAKRTNRKSSACIANSKKMTWSKANNLKQQVQMQKQNCVNAPHSMPTQNSPGEAAPKMTIPNGVRQVSMTALSNNLGNMNMPVTNLQNCHQLNIPQTYNGTVTSTNLGSFVAVPQNVMLTTLRIPQNGLPTQTINQQNNMNAFNKPNVNVDSPTKLNGQFVFPFVQNINGTVVQIPNLMAKMPNFMLPQAPQMARQDHLQNQQATQFLINGTLLKLANTVPQHYQNSTANKPSNGPNQSLPTLNKNMPGVQPVGMTVHAKPNYTVNLSHPVLMPQQGFIVTSVPNVNVKETWSCNSTNVNSATSTQQPICSIPMIQHASPMMANFTTQHLHSSNIPIPPVKPPDNPIQGTDPPSSTVKEPELAEITSSKCEVPWLSKTVNNNIIPFVTNKNTKRPFAEVSSLSNKLEEYDIDIVPETKLYAKPSKELEEEDQKSKKCKKMEEIESNEDAVFTEIIVKDVISDVHNDIIEANFCSTTMESSESGIGTDKSIDSPSDSQTSKECDEDSSLSLSVSVCSLDVQSSSQKSPILKQPKTLRFPPRSSKPNSDKRTSSTDTTSTVTLCLWENCTKEFDSDSDLLEHLQSVHVDTQAGRENYVCLWRQCKVRGKPSCSRLWLERHTQSHGGNKPFKCIVDSCDKRFSTQILLERHVNNHFNETSSNSGSGKKTSDSAAKLIRRNGKKLRYRRQPWSARMFDFFDTGIMEGLVWRLLRSTKWRLGGACPLKEMGVHTINLQATLMATRYNPSEMRKEALLTYNPPHVIEDEWVPEKDVKRFKRVEISQLSTQTKVLLYEQFCDSYKKPPTPPPVKKAIVTPSRSLPVRQCTSSRLLNNLLSKKTAESKPEPIPVVAPEIKEEEKTPEVSGAKKRKLGRRYGGYAFWPCGR